MKISWSLATFGFPGFPDCGPRATRVSPYQSRGDITILWIWSRDKEQGRSDILGVYVTPVINWLIS